MCINCNLNMREDKIEHESLNNKNKVNEINVDCKTYCIYIKITFFLDK